MESNGRSGFAGRLVAEGLVIVASILLAFALDTWWDATKERREERAALESLHEEFEGARDQLAFYLAAHGRIGKAAAGLADLVRRGRAAGAPTVAVPDTALALVYVPPTFNPMLGTLDGLLASGRLGLLRDPELRRSLAAWEGRLREGTEEEDKAVDFVFHQMDPVLRSRADVSGALELVDAVFSDTLRPALASRESRLRLDTEVAGVFAFRRQIEEHGIDDLEDVLAEIDRILALLETSLGTGAGTEGGP